MKFVIIFGSPGGSLYEEATFSKMMFGAGEEMPIKTGTIILVARASPRRNHFCYRLSSTSGLNSRTNAYAYSTNDFYTGSCATGMVSQPVYLQP